MKAILYVGAMLMAGASIYGFVDYKNSSRDKKFRTLYENKETVKPVESVKRGESTRTNTGVVAQPGIKESESVTNENNKPVVIKKKRKISAEKFSRAPLDEKYVEEKKVQSKREGKIKEKEL